MIEMMNRFKYSASTFVFPSLNPPSTQLSSSPNTRNTITDTKMQGKNVSV